MNYERIVQWAAGPTSGLAGWLATQIVNHWHIFGSLGIGHSQVGQAIFNSITFATTTLVTYAAHHKWLDNAAKWWEHAGIGIPAGLIESGPGPESAPKQTDISDTATALRKQLQAAGIKPEA